SSRDVMPPLVDSSRDSEPLLPLVDRSRIAPLSPPIAPVAPERSAAAAPPDVPLCPAAMPVPDDVVPDALLPALPWANAPIETPSDTTAAAIALLRKEELDIFGTSLLVVERPDAQSRCLRRCRAMLERDAADGDACAQRPFAHRDSRYGRN